jgi:sigma-B regulation protein RsbU (phosphoserine phosphatase)
LYTNDLPVGLQEPADGWHESTIGLAPGEALLSVSDGVLDIYDGTLAALDEVAAVFRESDDIAEFFARVQSRAAENPPTDDITILVVSRDVG